MLLFCFLFFLFLFHVSVGIAHVLVFPPDRGFPEQIIQKVMEMYRPTAVVLQCGADSLTGVCFVSRSQPVFFVRFTLRHPPLLLLLHHLCRIGWDASI